MDAVTRRLFPGLLHILCIQAALGDGCSEYRKKGCCVLCDPGYLLSQPCGPCLPCPVTGYTDKPNENPFCEHCRRCEGIFLYVQTCTTTRNAVCTCKAGMRCADEKCTMCETDRCSAGEELVGQRCERCPPGTFNSGAEHVCKPWTDCSGGRIITNGSRTSDVVCAGHVTVVTQSPRPPSTVPTTTTQIRLVVAPSPANRNLQLLYIAVSAAAVLVLVVICVLCRRELTAKVKQIFQTIKKTEEEESCDCRSPVQEGGGEDEPMTLVA